MTQQTSSFSARRVLKHYFWREGEPVPEWWTLRNPIHVEARDDVPSGLDVWFFGARR